MLWAAFCLGYFAFLRSAEFTLSTRAKQNGGLSVADVAVDSRQNSQILMIMLRRSNYHAHMAVCWENWRCHLPSTSVSHVGLPCSPTKYFQTPIHSPTTEQGYPGHLRESITNIGLNATNFSGHNFQIGAASAAEKAGF